MARISRFEHLKPEILQHFQEGMTPREVLLKFSDLPRGTVYRWFDELGQTDKVRTDSDSPVQSGFQPRLVGSASPEEKQERQEKTRARRELSRIRKALWNVIGSPDSEGAAVKVQALNAALKCLQVEQGLPLSDEDDEVQIDIAADVRSLSTEQLEKLAMG